MNRNLTFRKEKKRVNFDIVGEILVWGFQIGIVAAIAFGLVWFFGHRVGNVGDSMKPAISNGDAVLVNRLVYNAVNPKRGDLIVFKPKGNENSHSYIKRVIGLPGETVEIKDGEVYINGKALEEDYKKTEISDPGLAKEAVQLKENEYFVLGDNRNGSEDSRMPEVGNVKKKEIEGKAWFIITPGKHFGFL